MPVTEVFAGIAVRDRDAAIEFYERLLGAPPTMLPNDDETVAGQRAHDLDYRSRRQPRPDRPAGMSLTQRMPSQLSAPSR
jgi:hypothetical protein